MASFHEAFLGKRFVCCALTMVYSIYNTVGRSIASIYDLGDIYIGYGPPYRTIYIANIWKSAITGWVYVCMELLCVINKIALKLTDIEITMKLTAGSEDVREKTEQDEDWQPAQRKA